MKPNITIIPSSAVQSRPTQGFLSMASRGVIYRCLLASAVTLAAAGAAMAQTYRVTQINPPAGTSSSSVMAVNNVGQVVGNTSVMSRKSVLPGSPFVWDSARGAVSLPSLGSDKVPGVTGLSDSGLIVGVSPWENTSAPKRAVGWLANASTNAYSVFNWNAQVAGFAYDLRRAHSVSQDGQFVIFEGVHKTLNRSMAVVAKVGSAGIEVAWPIDTLGLGGPDLLASSPMITPIHYDIPTATLRMIFSCRTVTQAADSPNIRFIWQKTAVSPGVFNNDYTVTTLDRISPTGMPYSINGVGEIVGNYGDSSGISRGYFWKSNGTFFSIIPSGSARNIARSINDDGLVVGWYVRNNTDKLSRCFLWSRESPTIVNDLGSLKAAGDTSGVELVDALKINNAGQILANGDRSGTKVNVLLTPVP